MSLHHQIVETVLSILNSERKKNRVVLNGAMG